MFSGSAEPKISSKRETKIGEFLTSTTPLRKRGLGSPQSHAGPAAICFYELDARGL
jgi:hypothetical protein